MRICRMCGLDIADGAGLCSQCGGASSMASTQSGSVDAPQMFTVRSDLNGIGGWLILVALGLAIAPFNCLHGMYRDFRLLFGGSRTAMELFHGLAPLIMFEAITNTIFLFSLIGLNALFYCKSKSFPGWIITFLCGQLLVVLIDHLAVMRFSHSANAVPLLRSLVGAAIWIPYFLRSIRVKETFVH